MPAKVSFGLVARVLYPNYLNVAFFTEGWSLFFKEEVYPLSVLLGLVFLWHYLVAGWAVGCLLTHVAMVVGLRRVLAGGLCTSTKRLVGQTVIVTGANAGIGKETARDMFRRGARVILACRDVRKGEEARKDIVSTGGGGTAEVRRLDLSSLQSVREFADGIKNDDIQVHILINNAGLVASQYKETSDGFELHMGTNHLGPFLLTNLLLPQMKHGLPARIVNLSSCAHMLSPVDFNDFNNKKDYEMWNVYGRSKTANILFTRQLAKVLEGTNIQVFCVHPGIVATTILGREVLSQNRIDYLVALVAKTPVEGAQTTIYCAVEAKQHPEMYFSDCSVGWASSHAKDDAIADKLWKLSAKLVKLE